MKKGDHFSTIALNIGFYEVKSKKICCPKASKPLILLGFSKSSVSPFVPKKALRSNSQSLFLCFLRLKF